MEELEARMTALESEMRTRVTAVENEVRTVRMDAAAARVLAGGADRDVSAFAAKLDANKALLEALRETQIEQGRKLAQHDARFDRLEARFDRLEAGFDRLEAGFDGLQGQFDGLQGQFIGLQGRFDRLEGEMRTGFATMAAGQSAITTLLERLIDQEPDKA